MKLTIHKKQWFIILVLLLAWTVIIGSITIFNANHEHKQTEMLLVDQYRLLSAVLKTSWRWNSLHGGVFVPSNDSISLSQYLDEDDRMIISTQGDTLVKIIPVVMSNEMTTLSGTQRYYETRIVSKNPLNPANKAVDWEISALDYFEESITQEFSPGGSHFLDQYELSKPYGNNPEFRYISPIIAEESCLACHQYGIAEGSVMGGLSFSVINKSFFNLYRSETKHLVSSGIIIWIIGCVGILLIMKNISTRLQREMTLKKFEGVLEMAGSAAHELNQPLQVISGYAELISMLDAEDPKTLKEMMTAIRDNVFRLSLITRKLNGITRYETIELTSKDRIIDLDKAASDLISISAGSSPDKG